MVARLQFPAAGDGLDELLSIERQSVLYESGRRYRQIGGMARRMAAHAGLLADLCDRQAARADAESARLRAATVERNARRQAG